VPLPPLARYFSDLAIASAPSIATLAFNFHFPQRKQVESFINAGFPGIEVGVVLSDSSLRTGDAWMVRAYDGSFEKETVRENSSRLALRAACEKNVASAAGPRQPVMQQFVEEAWVVIPSRRPLEP
jgi:hypothetical protein